MKICIGTDKSPAASTEQKTRITLRFLRSALQPPPEGDNNVWANRRCPANVLVNARGRHISLNTYAAHTRDAFQRLFMPLSKTTERESPRQEAEVYSWRAWSARQTGDIPLSLHGANGKTARELLSLPKARLRLSHYSSQKTHASPLLAKTTVHPPVTHFVFALSALSLRADRQ